MYFVESWTHLGCTNPLFIFGNHATSIIQCLHDILLNDLDIFSECFVAEVPWQVCMDTDWQSNSLYSLVFWCKWWTLSNHLGLEVIQIPGM